MYSKLSFILFSILLSSICVAQVPSADISAETEWELQAEKDEFIVYTRKNKNSNIKEIRVIFEYEGSMENTLKVLSDVKGYPEWVYKSCESMVLDSINSEQYYYYISFDMPFPVWDRDNVILTSVKRDSLNKTIYYDSYAAPDHIPDKKSRVRVQTLESHWIIKDLGNQKIHIDYNGLADPAGSIPTWLANLAITAGPTKSFEKFRDMVQALDRDTNH